MKRPTYEIRLSYECWKCPDRHYCSEYVSADDPISAEERGWKLARGINERMLRDEGPDSWPYDYRYEGVRLNRGEPRVWAEQRKQVRGAIEKTGGGNGAV